MDDKEKQDLNKIKYLEDNLLEMKNYKVSEKNKSLPAFFTFCFFDDRVFPLTKYAIERYKKYTKISNTRLVRNLVESKSKKFDISKIEHNPNGDLTFEDSEIKISKHDWWLIGAAYAISNMINFCGIYIKNKKIKTLTSGEIDLWNRHFVEFSLCALQLDSNARKPAADVIHKKTNELKIKIINLSGEIYKKNPILNKNQIIAKILSEPKYAEIQGEIIKILKTDNPAGTIQKWLPNWTSKLWKASAC